MTKSLLLIMLSLFSISAFGQVNKERGIRMTSKYSSDNPEIKDILRFEGIEYLKLSFTGEELMDKSYQLIVKEIWNGEIKATSTVTNTATIPVAQFQKVNDTILNMNVISKLTADNKLKMTFKFPRFSVDREYDAVASNDYSLRNIAGQSQTVIEAGKDFYLLAYILPYEIDGTKFWCAVESSGKDIASWGKDFGIEHYLVFEMRFE